ncbi:hypothetical protein CYMTET_36595 [Cymbomonas tetramitiformis]|uniref:peptide-methionine (S)-S-oxide reductase n=1 Tax=Cymbomonas tetramitiformis TaxID=36881 RepID=A0AAE0F7T4_9CHLO|nr:hypothetical protein CYMTET_36595 [Cymbomonas tetramitiformis]
MILGTGGYVFATSRGDGHTEAIKIDYDSSKISYEELLDVFFKEHSATGKGKVQYKSGIWYQNEAQHKTALKKIKELEDGGRRKVATTVDPASKWFDAEEYHQGRVAEIAWAASGPIIIPHTATTTTAVLTPPPSLLALTLPPLP